MTTRRKTCQVSNPEHQIFPLFLIITQPYQKTDGTTFKALCVCLCVRICISVLQMDNSNQTWDSSQDSSFTAWTSLFLYTDHYQKEELQSSCIHLQRKRINPTLSSNSPLCHTCLCEQTYGVAHTLDLILIEISQLTLASVAWLMHLKAQPTSSLSPYSYYRATGWNFTHNRQIDPSAHAGMCSTSCGGLFKRQCCLHPFLQLSHAESILNIAEA